MEKKSNDSGDSPKKFAPDQKGKIAIGKEGKKDRERKAGSQQWWGEGRTAPKCQRAEVAGVEEGGQVGSRAR